MTYDQVAKAADELKAGHPDKRGPSVRAVFAVTGGNYNDVQKHMKIWRDTQVSTSPDNAPTLSAAILRAMAEEITQQRKSAISAQSADLENFREELEDLQREYGMLLSRNADLDERVQVAGADRERLTAERDHQAHHIEQLQQQASAERAAAENARIELAQMRLQTSGDALLVVTLRAEVDARRSEIEAERAARIEADRRLAASDATCCHQHP